MEEHRESSRGDEQRSEARLQIAPVSNLTEHRQWTDVELRMPLWLRDTPLPSHLVAHSKSLYIENQWQSPHVHLLALVGFAQGAGLGILRVREEYAAVPASADPKLVALNIVHSLQFGRDELLTQVSPDFVVVICARLDRLIEATSATIDAYLGDELDRILCKNPKCPKSPHMLPGPWVDAKKRNTRAFTDAFVLLRLLDDSSWERMVRDADTNVPASPNPSACPCPVFSKNERLVLVTMARIDTSLLVSASMIGEEMDVKVRLSDETIRKTIVKFIDCDLAHRPEGPRRGARLTNEARRLISRIGD